MSPDSRFALVAGLSAAAAACGIGLWLGLRAGQPERAAALDPTITGGYALPQPRELAAFELVRHDGAPFRREAFAGRWSFAYFGYTYCPDVCPLSLVELASLKRMIDASCTGVTAGYYLVSVDPRRDTPARLAEYVTYFDPDFVGLTGAPADLEALATSVGVVFDVPDAPAEDNYLVGHSSTLTVLDPSGRQSAVFIAPLTARGLFAGFAELLERTGGGGACVG